MSSIKTLKILQIKLFIFAQNSIFKYDVIPKYIASGNENTNPYIIEEKIVFSTKNPKYILNKWFREKKYK